MQGKCRRMGDDSLWLVAAVAAPKSETHKIVVLGLRNLRQPIEAVAGSLEIAGLDVVVQMRIVVANLRCLLRGKVAALALGKSGKLTTSGFSGAIGHLHKP